MTPESVLVHECEAAIADLQRETLKAPLKLDIDLAFGFEHLVDYTQLPNSLHPDYHTKLEVLLSHGMRSREATPLLTELGHDSNQVVSRPGSSKASSKHSASRPGTAGSFEHSGLTARLA